MHTKLNHYIPFFILIAATACCFISCQQVISVDLNNASPHIVIEGVVKDSMNSSGRYSVVLSMSGNYFAPSLYFPPVTGAVVVMADNLNQIDTLKEILSGSGIYQTSIIKGIPGTSYQLKVMAQGKEYDAATSMPTKVFIDSLYSIVRTGFGGRTGYDIYIMFKDPPELGNYYRVNVQSSAQIPADSIDGLRYRLFTDRLTNGTEMTVRIRGGDMVTKGDTITIDLLSIDKATYDYFNTLSNILSSDQSPTSLAPANPTTNISGGALGYFAAYTVDTKKIILK
jgi:Domain of unknown function (DUF4249)